MALVGLVSERRRPVLRGLAVSAAVLVLAQAFLGGLVVVTGLVGMVVLLHFVFATILLGVLLVIAFLANLRSIPKQWTVWAEAAADEEPASITLARMERGGAPGDHPDPGAPSRAANR
jgi:heme A synthase